MSSSSSTGNNIVGILPRRRQDEQKLPIGLAVVIDPQVPVKTKEDEEISPRQVHVDIPRRRAEKIDIVSPRRRRVWQIIPPRRKVKERKELEFWDPSFFASPRRHIIFDRPGVTFADVYTRVKVIDHLVTLSKHNKTGQLYIRKALGPVEEVPIQNIRREVGVMYHLNGHPNIVNLVEVLHNALYAYVITDILKGPSLHDIIICDKRLSWTHCFNYFYLKRLKGHKPFTEDEAREVFRQIASVIHYCHQMGVIHGNVTLKNFMFSTNRRGSILKAISFGSSKFYQPGHEIHESYRGTAPYVAPEIVKAGGPCFVPKGDVWSAGVILYALLSGQMPFWTDKPDELITVICKSNFRCMDSKPWENISYSAKHLVCSMLLEDPADRISSAGIMAHPWLRQSKDAIKDMEILRRFKKFQEMSKFKRLTLTVMAQILEKEEIAGLQNLYESINKSMESLTFEEMAKGLNRWGAQNSGSEIYSQLDTIDVNGDQKISFVEFVAAAMHTSMVERDDCLHKAFEAVDREDKGCIVFADVVAVMEKYDMTEEKRDEILEEVFSDKSIEIDYIKFQELNRDDSFADHLTKRWKTNN